MVLDQLKSQNKGTRTVVSALLYTSFIQGAFKLLVPRPLHTKPIKSEFVGWSEGGRIL